MIKTPGKVIAFDTETTGLWPWLTEHRKAIGLGPDRPFAFTFANADEESCIIRASVDPHTREVDYSKVRKELGWLKTLVGDPSMTVVMHNAAFDRVMCEQALSLEFKCRVEDTMLQSYTCRPTEAHGLKYLGKAYLGISDQDQRDLKEDLRNRKR